MAMFLSVYFFFMKVAKGYKDKEIWILVMKMMFVVGILLNIVLIVNDTGKKINNEKMMEDEYKDKPQ